MVNRKRWDVYVGFAPHVACLTTNQIKKLLKKKQVNLYYIEGDGWIGFVDKYKKGYVCKTWRVDVSELSVLPKGYNPETGNPYGV